MLLVQGLGQTVDRRVFTMGTWLDIQATTNAAESVLRAVDASEQSLSRWTPKTDIARLNRGEATTLPARTRAVLDRARHWSRWSEGAFTLHPDPERPHAIDTDAFAKGAALDHALQQSTGPLVLQFGGQIIVRDTSWKGRLAHPTDRHQAGPVLSLRRGSLATSGNAERPGHIRDPHSGQAVRTRGQVTVWAPKALDADCASTACFVLGPERALRRVDQTPDLECRFEWFDDDGTHHVRTSRHWNQHTAP